MKKLSILSILFVATLFVSVEATNFKNLGKKADEKVEDVKSGAKKATKNTAKAVEKKSQEVQEKL